MSSRGINRERQVKEILQGEDYWVCRAAGSLGEADLVALKEGRRLLIEVKSTLTAWSHFGPADRAELSLAAKIAGAEAWLYWWPNRGRLFRIPESDWPNPERAAFIAAARQAEAEAA